MRATKAIEERFAPFDEHATQALGNIQHTFEAIVNALPDRVGRASDLQHALKIDKVLSWRIYNVTRGADPFVAARYLPGSSAIKIFLRAAQKRGIASNFTDAAAAALDEFERLVLIHAGDRKRLDMMLASRTNDGRAEADALYRKTAFQANAYLWGVSASVTLVAHFAGFSEEPGQIDVAGLRGFVGLERIRADLRWPLAQFRIEADDGVSTRKLEIEQFYDLDDPAPEILGLLMSEPRPHLERVQLAQNVVQYDLLPGPVGKTGAVTCITGGMVRRVGSCHPEPGNLVAGYRAEVATPCELLVFDQFVHEGLFGRFQPELSIHSHLLRASERRSEVNRLPVQETVSYLGKASGALHTPEIPRYSDMVKYAFKRAGWDPSRFDVYRFRWEYPIMPSVATMENPLRPRVEERQH